MRREPGGLAERQERPCLLELNPALAGGGGLLQPAGRLGHTRARVLAALRAEPDRVGQHLAPDAHRVRVGGGRPQHLVGERNRTRVPGPEVVADPREHGRRGVVVRRQPHLFQRSRPGRILGQGQPAAKTRPRILAREPVLAAELHEGVTEVGLDLPGAPGIQLHASLARGHRRAQDFAGRPALMPEHSGLGGEQHHPTELGPRVHRRQAARAIEGGEAFSRRVERRVELSQFLERVGAQCGSRTDPAVGARIRGAKVGGTAELADGFLCERQHRRGQEVLRPAKGSIASHEERCRIIGIEQRHTLECCRQGGSLRVERQRTLRQLLHPLGVEQNEVGGNLRVTPAKFERAGQGSLRLRQCRTCSLAVVLHRALRRIAEPRLCLERQRLVPPRIGGEHSRGVVPGGRKVLLQERDGCRPRFRPPPGDTAAFQHPDGRVAQLGLERVHPFLALAGRQGVNRELTAVPVESAQCLAQAFCHRGCPQAGVPGSLVGTARPLPLSEQLQTLAEREARGAAVRRTRPESVHLRAEARLRRAQVMRRREVFHPHLGLHRLGQRAEPGCLEGGQGRAPRGPQRVAAGEQDGCGRHRHRPCQPPVAPGPLSRAHGERGRSRLDGLATLEAAEVLAKGLRRRVARCGFLLHRPRGDHRQLARRRRRKRWRVVLGDPHQYLPVLVLIRRLAPERRAAGERRVQRRSERVDVRPVIRRPGPEELFGAHEVERPGRLPRAGETGILGPGEPEVGHQGPATCRELLDEDIPRLDVTVDQPLAMRSVQPCGGLPEQLDLLLDGELPGQLGQWSPLDQLENDAWAPFQGPDLVHLHHVGVVHAGLQPRLEEQPLLTLEILPPEELHRDGAREHPIPGPVHLSHAAGTEETAQLDAVIQRGQREAHRGHPRATLDLGIGPDIVHSFRRPPIRRNRRPGAGAPR